MKTEPLAMDNGTFKPTLSVFPEKEPLLGNDFCPVPGMSYIILTGC